VFQGQDSAAFAAAIEEAWQQAVTLTENQDLLNAALTLLEDTAEQQLAAAPKTARPAVIALLRQIRTAMLRARLSQEAAKIQSLTTTGVLNQDISLTLLSSQAGESQTLAWLRQTPATWGCLGLWDTTPSDNSATLTVAGVYQQDGSPSIRIGDRYRAASFPPFAALPPPAQQEHDLTILCLLHAGPDDLGVLALCGFTNYNFTIDNTNTLWVQTRLLAVTLKRDTLVNHLETQALELAQARDAAEAANHAKSAFLAQMSHELRTPLNGILGYAQILKRQRLAPDAINGLTIIQQSGEHLLTLINDILDLAKIEAGKLELNLTPLHLPSFLDGIVGIVRARAQAKQLTLVFKISPSLPDWVQADETRLRQVLLNLLGNAIKFTDTGQLTLRVSAAREASDLELEAGQAAHIVGIKPLGAGLIRFEVADTGAGIAPEQLERIFQPFEQVGELRRQAEGAGLGLAISRQLVRLMSGELYVTSAVGRGSTFWFEAPVLLAETGKRAAAAHEREIAGYHGLCRTVLLADDIASNRAVLHAMLEPLGFSVLEAEDGRQAIELAQQAHPDLILMDRHMPVLSGVEAVRRIRQIPDLRGVPIIATSASVSEADQALIRAAGYDDFLPKPIAWPRLLVQLAEFLQLEWLYASTQAEAEEEGVANAHEAPAPPAEELKALFELATLGDILAVQARAAQLEQGEVRWRPFARRVAQLAGQFELEQILALLARYLPPNRHA
jgi:signal transduction histidine kinase/DNA-binding NarL/FixJ family response regulator